MEGIVHELGRKVGVLGPLDRTPGLFERIKNRFGRLTFLPKNIPLSLRGINAQFSVETFSQEQVIKNFGWEEGFIKKLIREVKKDDCILDIGGFMGLHAILAALRAGSGKVYSVEPDPYFQSLIRKNAKLNGVEVSVLPVAVSDEDGLLVLETGEIHGWSPRIFLGRDESEEGERKYTQEIEVPARSIDSLIENREIKTPNIIKIDTEGYEDLVLKGMKQLLTSTKKPRAVFIEVHPQRLTHLGKKPEDIEKLLEEYGYKSVWKGERRHDEFHLQFGL